MSKDTLIGDKAIESFFDDSKRSTDESEEEYVNWLLDNIHEISNTIGFPPIDTIEREYKVRYDRYHRCYIDVALFHEDNTATFIECKGDKRPNKIHKAIGQILMHKMMLNDRHDVEARFVLSAPNIPRNVLSVIKRNELPISILEVNNDKVTYI